MTTDPSDRAAEIAKSSALGRVAEGGLSGRSVLAAMGGVRGLIEALLPGIAFLVLFTITGDLWWSVGVPLALSVVFIIARLIAKQSAMPAIAGLIGTALSGFLALRAGDGIEYYLLGLYTNGAYGLAFLISIFVGWPFIGLAAGFLFNAGTSWRRHAVTRRWMSGVTLGWVAFFALRLAVQVPLYLAGNVEALGITRLVMGAPMYALLIVVTVLLVRSVFQQSGLAGNKGADDEETAASVDDADAGEGAAR